MDKQNLHFVILIIGALVIGLTLVACGDDEEKPKSYTVGAIIENPVAVDEAWAAFKEELATTHGYTEGENIRYYQAASDALLTQQVDPAELDLLIVFGGEFGDSETDAFPQAKALADGKTPLLVAPAQGDPVATGEAASLG